MAWTGDVRITHAMRGCARSVALRERFPTSRAAERRASAPRKSKDSSILGWQLLVKSVDSWTEAFVRDVRRLEVDGD